MRVDDVLDVSVLLPMDDELEELGVEVLALVSVDEEGIVEDDVVPLAPRVLVLELVLGVLEVVEPLAPIVPVLGFVLELVVLAFAPPPSAPVEPAAAPVPAAPAEAPVPAAPPAAAPEPLDWATATPPMARAAAAASVVRIFLDMSWTP